MHALNATLLGPRNNRVAAAAGATSSSIIKQIFFCILFIFILKKYFLLFLGDNGATINGHSQVTNGSQSNGSNKRPTNRQTQGPGSVLTGYQQSQQQNQPPQTSRNTMAPSDIYSVNSEPIDDKKNKKSEANFRTAEGKDLENSYKIFISLN